MYGPLGDLPGFNTHAWLKGFYPNGFKPILSSQVKRGWKQVWERIINTGKNIKVVYNTTVTEIKNKKQNNSGAIIHYSNTSERFDIVIISSPLDEIKIPYQFGKFDDSYVAIHVIETTFPPPVPYQRFVFLDNLLVTQLLYDGKALNGDYIWGLCGFVTKNVTEKQSRAQVSQVLTSFFENMVITLLLS